VKRLDGRTGIVDLFLTRRIPTPRADEREYLIVELKAPSVKIGAKETAQLRSYAFAIQSDERFRNMKVHWEFWVVSTDMTPEAIQEVTTIDRPYGMLDRKTNCNMWIRTWSEILNDSRARLQLFEKELKYNADKDDSLAFLRATYARIFSSDPEPAREVRSEKSAAAHSSQVDGATEEESKPPFPASQLREH
jgi:hypothetical protein